METRAGTDIQEEARNDRIEFKLKLREKMITEKLKRRIVPPSPQTAQTSLSKESSDAEVKEEPNLNKEAPEETKRKLDLNICRKKTKSPKRNVGYVPLHITSRKTVHTSIASTATNQATQKNTATKEKPIIYSTGYGKCSLNRKSPMKKDGKGKLKYVRSSKNPAIKK